MISETVNEKALEVRTHDIPVADAMGEFMKQSWAQSPLEGISAHPSVPFTKIRREKISKLFTGYRLVFPSGPLKVRSNTALKFKTHFTEDADINNTFLFSRKFSPVKLILSWKINKQKPKY